MELISSIDVSGNAVTVEADERFAEDYLLDDFRVKYDLGDRVPSILEGLAVIPFVANVAPVVWLAGLDVRVPILDATFARALDDVRQVFIDMYPSLRWNGSITADRLDSGVGASREQVALLFTGGVDSVYTSIVVDDPQLLATVRGGDVALDNDVGWEAVRRQAVEFARARGHQNAFIESNLRRFLDIPTLERRWPAVDEWWGAVQHGLGLLGLVAPLVPAGRVIISATHAPAYRRDSWGSNPRLDTTVRWGGATVDHHGYERSRQEKIEAIVATDGLTPELRVCFSDPYGDGGNCGRCEKCLRTFAGLVVAGAEPTEYGMPMSREKGARALRRRFATYRVAVSQSKAWYWTDIQASLANKEHTFGDERDNADDDSFLRWLSAFDFATYERRWRLLLRIRKHLLRVLRGFPTAERNVRRLVAFSHRLRERMRVSRYQG